ncbi:MAG: DUF11 domain-containing protein [Candidatus Competibacteraceae bacterium]|nr:DUF11 domain-containing protein [Candidatus Competibacteraceae bacterium]
MASGTGNIDALVTVPSGDSVTFTLTGTAPAGPIVSLVNTATVSPPAGVTDPTPGNNTGTDTNPADARADLSLSKASTPNPYVPGQPLTYTITVNNAGPSDATNARVQDTVPVQLAGFAWTCAPASAGASCATASGTGNIDALVTVPSGGGVTFTLTGTAPAGRSCPWSTPPRSVRRPASPTPRPATTPAPTPIRPTPAPTCR